MDKEYYPVSDTKENGIKNDNFKIISIYKIILDVGMVQIAKEKCDDTCKGNKIKKFRDGIFIPMKKWDKVSRDFDEKKALDPILVKEFRNTGYYEVIDGRHRCMMSHYNGFQWIPCNFEI